MSNYTAQVDGVHMHLENKKVGSFFFWYIWIMYALVYMTKYCFSSALAPIVESGMLTKSQTGLIAASFHIVYAPLQIIGGMFADRYNPERMIKIGLGGSAVANLIIFINQNYYVMLFAWIFNAVVQFPLWPSVFKIMASQLPRSERKKNAFYMSFCSTFGLLISYLVAGMIPVWRYNFLVSTLVSLGLMISMHFVCKKVDRYMLPDKNSMSDFIREKDNGGMTMKALAASSGLIIITIIAFLRVAVNQAANTMAPTMLMESYKNISASMGNILNLLIIPAGLLGTLLVKFVIYPRFIKNEVVGLIWCFCITIPFIIVLKMIGSVPVWSVIAAMCAITLFTSAAWLFMSYYNMYFASYGKDGAVAGILNCAGSAALIVQNYGFNVVADKFGWEAISVLWIWLISAAAILSIIVLPIFTKFKKSVPDVK